MSNIYIQEPSTMGKDDTIFNRIIKGFITQGGDTTGTGEGGKIYGEPFKDDFRTRLRSCRRGLIAMANVGEDDNGFQFFFTLGSTLELQNKYTIFGKVTGETIYNMLKFGEALVDENAVDEVYKEKREVLRKAVRRANPYYVESKNIKDTIYVTREKNVWHGHANMRIIKEMENEPLDDTIFNRIIKGFITQGGDTTGTGEGGKIYGEPFKDDFRTRLRSCRRGLIAMANVGEDDNGFQFFFTLGSTLELQNKYTIFGKVTGETIYNMLKFGEALVDENDRSLYPPRLIKTMLLNNPFADIPRIIVQECEEVKDSSKTKTAAVSASPPTTLEPMRDKGGSGEGECRNERLDDLRSMELSSTREYVAQASRYLRTIAIIARTIMFYLANERDKRETIFAPS
ncbi:Peptidyl-prolyl cis-trans isomerase CWC27 like protein [Eufriesea mexicana]|nr:Peptidyl-prolyl cis-trans isomerase CWC27 like protein [Eufriesea mexicana]